MRRKIRIKEKVKNVEFVSQNYCDSYGVNFLQMIQNMYVKLDTITFRKVSINFICKKQPNKIIAQCRA